MNKIPIVLSSDNNIFFTVATTLVSLLENANSDTFYEVHCLCAGNVTDENKKKLEDLKTMYSNFSLKLFDMEDKFENLPSTKGYHVNYVSAYKMLIPSMFPQYDRILYLDTDIIVRGDLSEFYNFDVKNNYIAGTPVLINFMSCYETLINLLQIDSLDYYCNAGVMLMNLAQIRQDGVDKKWISLLGSYKGSVDQHILNKVCYGRTSFIPLKFNVCLSDLPYYKNRSVGIFYSFKEADEAYNNPIIFHWTGPEKPWKYNDTFLAQEWMKYYRKTSFYDCKLKRNKCNYFTKAYVRKIKYYFWGIPLMKIKKDVPVKNKTYCKDFYYLFSFIRIFSKRVWRNK